MLLGYRDNSSFKELGNFGSGAESMCTVLVKVVLEYTETLI